MHIYIYTRTLSSEVNMYVYIDECTDCIVTFFFRSPGLCPWSYLYISRNLYTRTLSLELLIYIYRNLYTRTLSLE